MKKLVVSAMAVMFVFTLLTAAYAQTPAAPAAGTATAPAAGALVTSGGATPPPAGGHKQVESPGFLTIVMAGGSVGIGIWVMLFSAVGALIYFWTDCAMAISVKRVMPATLVTAVTQSMEEGDVFKALKHCEENPGPLSNVLSAGFSNVDQGFETIQDMISAAAQMESEKLTSRVTYLNVVSNMGPLLGLLGTVHGMIFAFATLSSTTAGAAQQAMLALNIAESLYCTAAGLLVAIPALGAFYYYKNLATRIVLGMEALTLDLVKSLRNVEVVTEE